ncbi:hypothetical protein IAD21_00204 [Abditibacteriota bacterium]|nr:hypothetical protein IAD21_00204 [Abditibacteriota bacterium]
MSGTTALASAWITRGGKTTTAKELIVATDAQGELHFQWSIPTNAVPLESKILLNAQAVDEANHAFGLAHDFKVTVSTQE